MAPEITLLQQINASLSSVPDSAMRSLLLAEKVQGLTARQAAELLQAIVLGASRDKGDYCLLLDALNVPLLATRLGNPFMREIYSVAQVEGFEELAGILSRPEASRSADQEPEPQDDLPSGVRISRAKQLRGPQLVRMFADTDPRVIRAVLQNPSLTESDVLKLCSRRPAFAAVQQEVMKSRKWIARYAVKKALIFNPYSPTELGLKLVHFLMLQDLRLVADSLDLHPAIREVARQKIKDSEQSLPSCSINHERGGV